MNGFQAGQHVGAKTWADWRKACPRRLGDTEIEQHGIAIGVERTCSGLRSRCTKPCLWTAAEFKTAVMADGTTINYALALPNAYDAGRAYPLLLALPPGGQIRVMVKAGLSVWEQEGRARGYIVVSSVAPGELFFRRRPAIFRNFSTISALPTPSMPPIYISAAFPTAASEKYPDRLIGLFMSGHNEMLGSNAIVARGPWQKPDLSQFADNVRHWVEDLGMKGFGEFGVRTFSEESDPIRIARDLMPVMEIINEYKIPVLIHTAWTQFGTRLYHGIPIFVDDLAEQFPRSHSC